MGAIERRGVQTCPLTYGMHVIDAHEQILGTVLLVREDHFVIRQQLGINQTVALPWATVSGVVAGFVFLNLTPGEIPLYGKILERRDRSSGGFSLIPRLAAIPDAT